MFLNYSVINYDSFLEGAIPARQTFNKITLLGESIVDEMHLHNIEMTNNSILALNDVESFGADTLMLAHMENNLNAGDYTGLDTPINKYLIMKRKVGDSQYTLVAEITQDSGINQVVDYLSKNNIEYEYAIFPVSSTGVVGTSSTATIISNFFGWFLISSDNQTIYKFDMEINTDNIQIMEDFKIFDNYTQYAVTSQGKRKYATGRLTTIPYTLNGSEIIIDVSLLDELQEFIENGEAKYLKNTAGQLMMVSTHNFSYKYYDQVSTQPYTVSWDFVQIGSGE